MLVTTAIFFNFPSKDFLLPYSSPPPIPEIAAPNPHFGDISKTEVVKIIPTIIIKTINKVFIKFFQKIKILNYNIIISLLISRKKND
ncbi:hypothetical protein II582_04495 [bacterium]|nr:hypothetical protein [bacterium]